MVQAENQAIKAKIDKSVDLKNLQTIANEKFGMVRPENYQVFYVNLDSGDYSENVIGVFCYVIFNRKIFYDTKSN